MKRLLIVGLALLLLSSALFADDASVMPGKIGRVYVAPTYSFTPGAYDTDGEYKKFDNGSVKLFNLGFALEYGVIDWITAAVQWVPGWTFWSDIKAVTGTDNTNMNGVADLFAGAKFQLVGEKAPFKSSAFRFSIAPGAIIPLPGPDFEQETKNLLSGKEATLASMDKHVLAAGGRVYFDFIFNENFFINLFNETILYPIKQDLEKDSPTFYITKAGLAAAQSNPLIMGIEGKVDYKYKLTFELEPVVTVPILDGVNFSAGLPVTYKYAPASEYSYTYPDALSSVANMIASEISSDPSQSLAIYPNVSLFLTKLPLPLQFKFMYGFPLWGQNTSASHNINLQIRAYFASPGR